MVVKRRRYDTVELIAEIRRERRNGLILALAGVGILILLLGLYISRAGDEKVPTAPGSAAVVPLPAAVEPKVAGTGAETLAPARAAATAPRTDVDEAGASTEAGKPNDARDAAAKPASLQIQITRKALLWVDGKRIGKVKKHLVELEPGNHEIKVKLGKKMVTQKLAPKPGAAYLLRVDGKRKKAVLKKQ